jgi:hypothetical protein
MSSLQNIEQECNKLRPTQQEELLERLTKSVSDKRDRVFGKKLKRHLIKINTPAARTMLEYMEEQPRLIKKAFERLSRRFNPDPDRPNSAHD